MAAIITTVGEVATFVIGLMGEVVTEVIANPILLIPTGLGIVSFGAGLMSRFLPTRR